MCIRDSHITRDFEICLETLPRRIVMSAAGHRHVLQIPQAVARQTFRIKSHSLVNCEFLIPLIDQFSLRPFHAQFTLFR